MTDGMSQTPDGGSAFSSAHTNSKMRRKHHYDQLKHQFPKPEIPKMHEDYIKRRQEINLMSIFNRKFHPLYEKVINFKLKETHKKVTMSKVTEIQYIDNYFSFFVMIQHLNTCDEFAIDSEFSHLLFRECIALIQISTSKFDFIIDPFLT